VLVIDTQNQRSTCRDQNDGRYRRADELQ